MPTISHSSVFLNWTHFFLYLHGIFVIRYNQACISLFSKKRQLIESKLYLPSFPLINSFILIVMNCVLIFPTRFLFKTYFCWKIYLKTLFFLCFCTVSSLGVIVCLMNESEITHFVKPFPTMGGDRNLNVCFECEKNFNTQNFFQIIKIQRNIVCLLLLFHKQGKGNTSFRNHVSFRFTISRKEKTHFTISRSEKMSFTVSRKPIGVP